MNTSALFGNLLDVTIAGILLGAGLPALFALGIRLAHGPSTGTSSGPTLLGKAGAVLCFAAIIAAIIAGILWITNGTIHQYLGVDIFGVEG